MSHVYPDYGRVVERVSGGSLPPIVQPKTTKGLDVDASVAEKLGRLEARVEGLEDWTKSLSQKLDEMSRMLASINNELAAAKGASRVVIGLAMVASGIVSWLATHVVDRVLR